MRGLLFVAFSFVPRWFGVVFAESLLKRRIALVVFFGLGYRLERIKRVAVDVDRHGLQSGFLSLSCNILLHCMPVSRGLYRQDIYWRETVRQEHDSKCQDWDCIDSFQ